MNRVAKGAAFMLVSALGFAIMSAFVKLAGDLPVWEKVFFRNLVSLFISWYSITTTHKIYWGQSVNRKFLAGRALTGLIGMVMYFYALDRMLLADANMLVTLSPFFVTLFAWVILKEKRTPVQLPALIVLFAASLLIIKPRFDLAVIPALVAFLSAVTTGISHTLVRFMGNKEKPDTIIFYFSLISTIIIFPFIMVNFVMPDTMQWIFLLATGIFAAVGQFGLTYAYRNAPASKVTVFNFSGIVFSGALGFLIWGEISDYMSIAGAVLILCTAVFLYVAHRKADAAEL